MAKSGGHSVALEVRRGEAKAVDEAIGVITDPSASLERRQQLLELLGEVKHSKVLPVLLKLVADPGETALHKEALTALQQYDEPAIGVEVAAQFTHFTNDTRAAALTLLASRPAWALQLLRAVDAGQIRPEMVQEDALQKIRAYRDAPIAELARKHWGQERVLTTAEMSRQIERYAACVRDGLGDPYEGRRLFTMSCGLCHKLFGQGAQIGPDLTPYKRDDLETMLLNIVNPNAEIREGYENYLVTTKDGRSLSGFLADKDTRVVVLRGLDGVNLVLPQEQIQEMKPAGRSLMPEGLLTMLTQQQVRDLFAYLRSTQPLVGEPPPRATAAAKR
jgi:putative heme-binding domain-containing protein